MRRRLPEALTLMTGFERLALSAWLAVPALSALLSAAKLDPSEVAAHFPACLFRLVTGLPCPGCGMLRGLMQAWRLDWAGAFHHHPLALPLLALWSAWVLRGALNARRGKPFSEGLPRLRGLVPSAAALGLVLAVYFLR